MGVAKPARLSLTVHANTASTLLARPYQTPSRIFWPGLLYFNQCNPHKSFKICENRFPKLISELIEPMSLKGFRYPYRLILDRGSNISLSGKRPIFRITGYLKFRRMNLHHLNSDQRQYLWICLAQSAIFIYIGLPITWPFSTLALFIAVIETACAIAIYRNWRFAHWLYLLGCFGFVAWALLRWSTKGYSPSVIYMLIGGLAAATGFYWLGKAMQAQQPQSTPSPTPASDLFHLPKQHEGYVDRLTAAYQSAFGPAQWVHHVVPKVLWLHRYADYIITIPPTAERTTWLYGTLLISALSNHPVELILERSEEDTIGAIGTLSQLTEYYLDHAPLEDWNTMGSHPFFGEDSSVRGLLFCPPPAALTDRLPIPPSPVRLRYVAGITEDQLTTSQALDDSESRFAGAKKLYTDLEISSAGISNLPV